MFGTRQFLPPVELDCGGGLRLDTGIGWEKREIIQPRDDCQSESTIKCTADSLAQLIYH